MKFNFKEIGKEKVENLKGVLDKPLKIKSEVNKKWMKHN